MTQLLKLSFFTAFILVKMLMNSFTEAQDPLNKSNKTTAHFSYSEKDTVDYVVTKITHLVA